MAFFFSVVGLEVRREFSVGELRHARNAVLPAVAATAGVLVPAALYLSINPGGDAAHGWGVVIGTDTAFLLASLALFGPSSSAQLRVLLLTITVFDDILAIGAIGLFYSDAISVPAIALAAGCVALFIVLDRMQVWRVTMYAIVGVILWLAVVESGLHPTIAGMVGGLLIAARPPRRDDVERAASLFRAFRQSPLPEVGYTAKIGLQRAVSVNERLQQVMHGWTSLLVVPVFAFANAGVDLRGGALSDAFGSRLMWGVVVGLVAGKLIGVGLVSVVSTRLGAGRLPIGVGPGQVLAGGALSGIGFTVSLLVIDRAFDDPRLHAEATIGVLVAAAIAAGLGALIFRAAAVFLGETTAQLPVELDEPVDPERDHMLGPAGAPLTLLEYGDFECPFCSAATGVVRDLRVSLGDELRYVFRHLPLRDVHPHAELAAQASEAAAAQGKFWEMHDMLFERQSELEFEDLLGYADRIGLDVERFARALGDSRHALRVDEDARSGYASGARGTPTFFVGGKRHIGPHDSASLLSALNASRAPIARA
jgi:Na+/H+ antiporter NhaA